MARGAVAPKQPRFYCEDLPHPRLGDPVRLLDAEQTRHLRKVLRLREGNPLELFDGTGGIAWASLTGFEGGHARCECHAVEFHNRPLPRITLASAIPKGPAAEAMAQQLSQLGADRLIPLKTERSVVHPRPQKRERFEKAAIESAKQSGRLFLMQLSELYTLDQVLKEPADMKLALTPGGEVNEPDRSALREAHHVMVLVGPEGGFTGGELDKMEEQGAQRWTIGPNVLRIETAATAVTAITRFLAMAE
jgi:16S rRNA (uracil1498-N3)-methyltransferase